MKKIKFTGKLSLNKETISKLNDQQMEHVNGGGSEGHSGCTGSRYCSTDTACPTDVCLTTARGGGPC